MRKLIVQQWVTVDNIVAEEDGGLSFVDVVSFPEMPESEFKTSVMMFIDSVDTMILGANTYALFKDYWPNTKEEGEFGDKLNRLNKIVASTKIKEAPWGEFSPAIVTADPLAIVKKLKQKVGKDIVLWGSLTLMKTMFENNLVDEIQLRVCPTTRGKGKHMFTDQQELRLIKTTSFENGIVFMQYEVQK